MFIVCINKCCDGCGGLVEFFLVAEEIPAADGIGCATCLNARDEFGLHDERSEERHFVAVNSTNRECPRILKVFELGAEAKTVSVWIMVFRPPRDINRVAQESFLKQSIKSAARFTIDLNLEGLGFHRSFVFFGKAGVAESEVVIRDYDLGAAGLMNSIVDELSDIRVAHLGRMNVSKPT